MIKKLLAFLLLAVGAFTVGVAIYDVSIITNVTNQFFGKFQTAIPSMLQGIKENPVATVAGAAAIVAPILTITKIVYDIKKKASQAIQSADSQMKESSKVAYNALSEVDGIKNELATTKEEYQTKIEKSQDLTTKLQLENDRLKRENDQLKTEYGVLQTEHESLKERVQLKKVIE